MIVKGLNSHGQVHWNLSPAAMFEAAVRRREGEVTSGGAFNAITKPHTGRSPNDKFACGNPALIKRIFGWGGSSTTSPSTPTSMKRSTGPVSREHLQGPGEVCASRTLRRA